MKKYEKTLKALITTVSAIIALIGFAAMCALLVVLYETGVIDSAKMDWIDKTVATTVISGAVGGLIYTMSYLELNETFLKDLCQEDDAD